METELTIISEKTGECVCICHVAIGEVWLAGGQSNMEFLMKYDEEAEKMLSAPPDPYLRYFRYPCANYTGCLEQHAYPDDGFWRRWEDPSDRSFFSAPAAYMGKKLRETLGVPVGFIGCCWGGTPAAAWTAVEDMEAVPELKTILEQQEKIDQKTDYCSYLKARDAYSPELPPVEQERADLFMMGVPIEEIMKKLPPMPVPRGYGPFLEGPFSCVRPGGLYESIMQKVAPYGIRGAVWYQGEDDDFRGRQSFYDKSMITLIKSWRKLWGKEFPFLQVELAPFEGAGITGAKAYALMRHKQRDAAAALKDVHDVCIMDAGHRTNIHVRKKRPVGERLALLARKYVYGEASLAADSPEFLSAERDGEHVIVRFANAGDGLVLMRDPQDVLQAVVDGKTVIPKARAQGEFLFLDSPEFAPAQEIRLSYMEQNYCEAAIFRSCGLPVFSFEAEVKL